MPLIIISGYPTSGKTYRVQQLLSLFRAEIAAAQAAISSQTASPTPDSISIAAQANTTAANTPASASTSLSFSPPTTAATIHQPQHETTPSPSSPPPPSSTSTYTPSPLPNSASNSAASILFPPSPSPSSPQSPLPIPSSIHSPSSPFTTRLARLKLVHISDDTLSIPRSVYDDASSEKAARGAFSSAIKRALGRDTLVIADGMNYIKGFRYQMFCEAKGEQGGGGSCVLHVDVPPSFSTELQSLRLSSSPTSSPPPYTPSTYPNLLSRYEAPSPFSRWDSPLFTLPSTDAHPPYTQILTHFFGTSSAPPKPTRANLATVAPKAAPADALYILEKATQEVIRIIGEWKSLHAGEGGGGVVKIQGRKRRVVEVQLPLEEGEMSAAGLQRLRRQFVGMWRSRGVLTGVGGEGRGVGEGGVEEESVREGFVGFLNGVWGGVGG